jgi:hypothetical protein
MVVQLRVSETLSAWAAMEFDETPRTSERTNTMPVSTGAGESTMRTWAPE